MTYSHKNQTEYERTAIFELFNKSKSKSSDGAHHCHVVQRASINSSLIKVTFVLRETDVIQPS